MFITCGPHRLPVRFHPRRRRLALVATPEGVEVRAPAGLSHRHIESFVRAEQTWIEQALAEGETRQTCLWGVPTSGLTAQQAQKVLKAWLAETLPRWCAAMDVTPRQVRVRAMRSSWGRCSASGTITLALDLAQLPQTLAEYVLVHELAHLRHLHHGPDFWALVDRHLPDRRERVTSLRKWEKRLRPLAPRGSV
ncbi:YgjP-like metallopeptidase domain-containing protein [Sulfurivirga sp.]|uniref:M48 family metallopeptidase n=1 Tax=Sulfurivirga sp. TaxID=2614236 RepID=UPI0025D4CBAB|nr:YgjP-like metallopeptidase domain-containing protein [Sulfurivirga sp.]